MTLNRMCIQKFTTAIKIPLNYFDLVRSATGLAPLMPTTTLPHHQFTLSELLFFHGKFFVCCCNLSPRNRRQGNKIKSAKSFEAIGHIL